MWWSSLSLMELAGKSSVFFSRQSSFLRMPESSMVGQWSVVKSLGIHYGDMLFFWWLLFVLWQIFIHTYSLSWAYPAPAPPPLLRHVPSCSHHILLFLVVCSTESSCMLPAGMWLTLLAPSCVGKHSCSELMGLWAMRWPDDSTAWHPCRSPAFTFSYIRLTV